MIWHEIFERGLHRRNVIAEHGESFNCGKTRICRQSAQIRVNSLTPKHLAQWQIWCLGIIVSGTIHHDERKRGRFEQPNSNTAHDQIKSNKTTEKQKP
jgi:hypothetical protein